MYIACSPITWGPLRRQEGSPYAGDDGTIRILDEIRAAGYTHAAASVRRGAPAGDPTPDPRAQVRLHKEHGLEVAPGSIGGVPLRDPQRRAEAVDTARQAAAYTRGLGLDALFLMPESERGRWETAGQYPHGDRPDSLGRDQVQATCETLNRMGEACRAEGVWLCLHNHAGMFWETEDEFEPVIAGTDPALVAMGPDVGHMVYGGIDPLSWFRRHLDRVKSIHIKDVDAAVLERARAERLTYQQAGNANLWVEIGSGCVDWPALFALWRESGYDGAVVVESDRTPLPTPAASVAKSRTYLRETCGV